MKAHAGDRTTGLQAIPASEVWFLGELQPQQFVDRFIRTINRRALSRRVLSKFIREVFMPRQTSGGGL